MSREKLIDPVNDDAVPKVDDAVAVGEDLAFQERWWKFERVVWIVFLLILIADALGLFGRGWLANTEAAPPGSAMDVKYERVARTFDSSLLTIRFSREAMVNNQFQVFASDSLLKELGMQRVVPQPSSSIIGNGGVTYTFPASSTPAMVQFDLQPRSPGILVWTLQVPGKAAVRERVVVVP